MRLPSLSHLLEAVWQAARRFPFAFLAAVVATVVMIWLIEIERGAREPIYENLSRVNMAAILGVPLFIALSVFAEMKGWARDYRWWALHGIGLVALALYGWNIEFRGFDHRELPEYLALLVASHLCVSFAPYLNNKKTSDFWEYNKQLFGRWLTAAAYGLIIWIGLSAAILSVDELFEVKIHYSRYPQLFVLIGGLFHVPYFLFHIPKDFEFDADEISWEQTFSVLVKYILIPITLLYLLILYAFSAKIIFNWQLPNGWVSKLVIGFAAAGIFTWLLNFMPARRRAGQPHHFFAQWFWPLLLPMIGLLFVAIGRRIGDYGVTELRFLVAHIGVWLLVCALYYVVTRRDNLKFIPVSLTVFVLAAFFGPLNMYRVSERNQIGRLQSALERNDRWAAGQVKTSQQPMNEQDAETVAASLEFMDYRDMLDQPVPWLAAMPIDTSGVDAQDILKWLNIKSKYINDVSKIKSYWVYGAEDGKGIAYTENVRLLLPIWASKTEREAKDQFEPGETGQFALLGTDNRHIVVYDYRDGAVSALDSFDLLPWMRRMSQHEKDYITPSGKERLTPLRGHKLSGNLLLNNASIQIEGDSVVLGEFSGLLLLK